jgi:hypothetical protein
VFELCGGLNGESALEEVAQTRAHDVARPVKWLWSAGNLSASGPSRSVVPEGGVPAVTHADRCDALVGGEEIAQGQSSVPRPCRR